LARNRPFDPLALIPSTEAIKERLAETEVLAGRLRLLLELAERLRSPQETGQDNSDACGQEGCRG
jgi:hypothetical protein